MSKRKTNWGNSWEWASLGWQSRRGKKSESNCNGWESCSWVIRVDWCMRRNYKSNSSLYKSRYHISDSNTNYNHSNNRV